MRHFVFALCLVASPVVAQDLSADFEELGRVNLTLDGVAYEMYAIRDVESGDVTAEENIYGGIRTINIFAGALDATGVPNSPGVSFAFTMSGDTANLISLDVYDDQGWQMPLSIGPDGGSGGFDSFSMADRQVTATFSGDMARIDMTDGENPKIAEGTGPVAISGEMSVEVVLRE